MTSKPNELAAPLPIVCEVFPGYEPLFSVLRNALDQAQRGKGAERHANSRPFEQQPIAHITEMVGVGFPLGQAIKKAQEASGMLARGNSGAAERELLGAIVYLAAAVLAVEGQSKEEGEL